MNQQSPQATLVALVRAEAQASDIIRTPARKCRRCANKYLAVTWIGYRVAGYCSDKCAKGAFFAAKAKAAA